jgi:hypothetical protein
MNRSQFGRIPQATVSLLQQTRQQVYQQILPVLPPNAPQKARDLVAERIIGIVLRDWRENGNATGLTSEDVTDMQNFVQAAVSVSGPDLNGDGWPIFSAVLSGMLEEWLANWNSENDPGPPGPVD